MSEPYDVVVARIGKPHGIKGEVTVEVRTDEPRDRFVVGARFATRAPRNSSVAPRVVVRSARWHQERLLLAFDETPDRNAAELLRGTLLLAQLLPTDTPDDPDEFYLHELIGLHVRDTDGNDRGEVTGLVSGAAQDLLSIRTPQGERLVPFVQELVPEVDIAGGSVVVADRPGLLTESDDE